MTEQELREKTARTIAKHLCKNRYSHFQLYGDSANCYSRENFAECEVIADTVDALIAAGIGDVSEYERLKIELRSKVDYIHELWDVKEDYKHRAEVAEKALKNEIKLRLKLTNYSEDAIFALYPMALEEAEKQLAEEMKDG